MKLDVAELDHLVDVLRRHAMHTRSRRSAELCRRFDEERTPRVEAAPPPAGDDDEP